MTSIMSRLLVLMVLLVAFGQPAQGQTPEADSAADELGLLVNTPEATPGYILFGPTDSERTYLIDNEGNLINMWISDYWTGHSMYLLENGNLLRLGLLREAGEARGWTVGGAGGIIEEFTWDGELVWSYEYHGADYFAHHDIELLPNGNMLILGVERRTSEEAVALGMRPDVLPEDDQGVWPDYVVEIVPETGEVVWEWYLWDHLIQDYDERLPNFGDPAEHPERVDINFFPVRGSGDWTHGNAIHYNPELEQIALSLRNMSEIWIIDHSTTTEEAATGSGGNSGMGGRLLYRWGNPRAYGSGNAADQQLFGQHDVRWIPPGFPGEGNLMIFNNGYTYRNYSSVIEITPPLNADGTYDREPGEAWGPEAPAWEYVGDPPESFYSRIISGAHRLPNGNTVVTEGVDARIFELTPDGEIVWEFRSPDRINRRPNVFRATRYLPDYPGLQGQDLTPIMPLTDLTFVFPGEDTFAAVPEDQPLGALLLAFLPDGFDTVSSSATVDPFFAETNVTVRMIETVPGDQIAHFETEFFDKLEPDQRRFWFAQMPDYDARALPQFEAMLAERGFASCELANTVGEVAVDAYARSPICCTLGDREVARFGDGFVLEAIDVAMQGDETLALTSAWHVVDDVPPDTFSVSFQVFDSDGEKIAQIDEGLVSLAYTCKVNNLIVGDLAPGDYAVRATVYNPSEGANLPVTLAGADAAADDPLVPVATFTVE